MAKIDFSESSPPFLNPAAYIGIKAEPKKTKDKPSSRKSQSLRFSGILERVTQHTVQEAGVADEPPVSEETVKNLLDEVHTAGDDLKNRPLPEEIKRYKKAVKDFLHYVVKNGYTTEKQVSGANLLKRKKFTLVQVVDAKLEQLAAGTLAGQIAQLEMLHRLEEITGMLVDLMQ
jgi:uncharacterized protein YaaR (DUF327 family)